MSAARACPAQDAAERYTRCTLELSWPIENLGPSLPNLVATVAGNLFELRAGLRPAARSTSTAAVLRRRLPGPAVRHRRDAAAGRRRERPADRHDHQAERRPVAGGDGRRWSQRSSRAASTSSRTTSCRPTGRTARSTSGSRAVMRVVNDARRPHRQEGDGRLQRHRRARRDAPAPRPGARRRRHLRHGRASTRSASSALHRAAPPRAAADPRPPQRLGHTSRRTRCSAWTSPPWQKLWRLAGADHIHVNGLATSSASPTTASSRSAQRRARRRCSPSTPMRDAGVQLGPDGPAGAPIPTRALGSADLIYAAGGGIIGHPAASAAGVAAHARGVGRRRSPACRCRARARQRRRCDGCAGVLAMSSRRADPAATACCSPSTATTSPARPTRWRR